MLTRSTPVRPRSRRAPVRRSVAARRCLGLAPCALGLLLCSCPSPKPKPTASANTATLLVVNGATQSSYDVFLDNTRVLSVGPQESRDVRVSAPASRRLDLRFAGSDLPACNPATVNFNRGATTTVTCSRDCKTESISGIRFSNRSSETHYRLTFGNESLGDVGPGQTTDVKLVRASNTRMEATIAGTSLIACAATIAANPCQVQSYNCNVDYCKLTETGKVRFRNTRPFSTFFEIGSARILLAPNQTSEPVIQPAGKVHVALRNAATNAVICGGPVDVVPCQTRTYHCD